jgi:hypothetical protein
MLIEFYLDGTTDPLAALDYTGQAITVPVAGDDVFLHLYDEDDQGRTRHVRVVRRELWFRDRHPTRGTPGRAEAVVYVTDVEPAS